LRRKKLEHVTSKQTSKGRLGGVLGTIDQLTINILNNQLKCHVHKDDGCESSLEDRWDFVAGDLDVAAWDG
jgi:hypothetical protein